MEELKEKLPDEDKKKRRALFRQFDANGNGVLSLAEIDKGLELILPQLFELKPVIMRAY